MVIVILKVNTIVARRLPERHKYASCPYDGKILQYYKDQFESVFVMLHPFFNPKNIELEAFYDEKWPTKAEIVEGGEPVLWSRILTLTGFSRLSEIDIALRTNIGSLGKKEANPNNLDILDAITEAEGLIYPTEGELAPLLENRLFRALQTLNYQWVWVGDEFCTERKLCWIDDLIQDEEIPYSGCIFTHDCSLLITTHWDSHCSFLCSSKAKIESILAIDRFEGFYCTDRTEVYWGLHEI